MLLWYTTSYAVVLCCGRSGRSESGFFLEWYFWTETGGWCKESVGSVEMCAEGGRRKAINKENVRKGLL